VPIISDGRTNTCPLPDVGGHAMVESTITGDNVPPHIQLGDISTKSLGLPMTEAVMHGKISTQIIFWIL
jgi:hypothetical protein